MALSDSAVSELLDAFRAGDGVDLVRESVRLVLQELIEVEDADSRARKSMYSAVVKALPGRKAIRYLQLESKVQAGYRYEVATTFPLIK